MHVLHNRTSDAVDDGRSEKPNKVLETTPIVNHVQNDEVNRNIYINLWYIIYTIFTVCTIYTMYTIYNMYNISIFTSLGQM